MTTDSLGELGEAIRQLARVPRLLVASDYDGVIAPLVDDPMAATPTRESVTALRALCDLPRTDVAVISGRSLHDLALLSRFPEEIRLVGSHGSEFDLGYASQLPAETVALRDTLIDSVSDIGRAFDALVEPKPNGVTFHFRGMDASIAERARDQLVRGPATLAGVHTRNGNQIIEFSVVETNKGTALEILRSQVSAGAVFFMGDDVTDEDGFVTLRGPDVGVKVGDGPTAAGYRIADPGAASKVLALLAELRADWLRGAGLVPIEDHSMLTDLRTAAIVDPSATVNWLCTPRVDSAAVFAALVGGPSAGQFSVQPADGATPVEQRYEDGSMVLTTEFPTFSVTDYLDVSGGRSARLAGRSDLVRRLSGTGEVTIEFSPRLDFGRVPTRMEVREDGIVLMGSADLMVLRSPGVTWTLQDRGVHHTAIGHAELSAGEPLLLELRAGTGTLRADSRDESTRHDDNRRFWTNWSDDLELPKLRRDLVERSALTLKGLTHGPTGAILSAATTSLPEHFGGVRNWDYRYCWLRDASLTASSLVRLGSHGEGLAFLDWVLGLLETRTDPERLAPLYNVTGRHLPPEAEIAELSGYGGSRPVRVGNAADGQVQLDVFGPVVDLVHLLHERGETVSSEHWRLVEAMVLAVSRRWHEPDHGIWEVRKPPRHHVYSKVMCWVTVDRAIRIADQFLDREPSAWVSLRDEIEADVLTNGWSESQSSFRAAYDGDDLDASVLAIGMYRLIDPSDERFVATVAAVERELRNGPTVFRYLTDDGLPGRGGGFTLMTAWLAESLALIGRRDDALALFDQLCDLAGTTGLLTEQFDPASGRSLGNIPQAYSHLGLINAALALEI